MSGTAMATALPSPAPRPSDRRPLRAQVGRQLVEVAVIGLVSAAIHRAWATAAIGPRGVCLLVAAVAIVKTAYFLLENLQHILLATSHEIPYHRFLGLMGVNMSQIAASFALDFWLLELAEPGSFTGFAAGMSAAAVFFDCCFYSVLNFSFFGFGDILPQTPAAKVVTLLEVILAFFTVIFLLSDFISLKDSLRGGRGR